MWSDGGRRGRLASTAACVLLAGLLTACAGPEIVRGELVQDLRPKDQRSDVAVPPQETPRFRHVGELVGQPNFDDPSGTARNQAVSLLKWAVGLLDSNVEGAAQQGGRRRAARRADAAVHAAVHGLAGRHRAVRHR